MATPRTAVARPGMEQVAHIADPDEQFQAWLQAQYNADPAGTLAHIANSPGLTAKYEVKDGIVQRNPRSFFMENPWMFTVLGAGGALGAAALAGGLGGSAAAGGAQGGLLPSAPATTGMAGMTGAPTITAAAGGSAIPTGAMAGALGTSVAPAAATGATGGAGGLLGQIPGLGSLGQYSDLLGSVGQIAGNAAAGSAQQRASEAEGRVRADEVQRRSRMLAALLGGLQDANITSGNPNIQARMPQVTGGLRPSAMLDGGRRQALMDMLNQPVDLPRAGATENILGGVGLGASILGALGR